MMNGKSVICSANFAGFIMLGAEEVFGKYIDDVRPINEFFVAMYQVVIIVAAIYRLTIRGSGSVLRELSSLTKLLSI